MTSDEMRIAIAETIGWKQCEVEEMAMHYSGGMRPRIFKLFKLFKRWFLNPPSLFVESPPNYPEDLNAMHEVEKAFAPADLDVYENFLIETLARHKNTDNSVSSEMIWHAAAHQRAEAYLRMKGLWKD